MEGQGQAVQGQEVVARSPFSVFPEELWCMVFNQIESSDDLTTVSESNSELAALLNRSKTTWLFDKVLPILFPYLTPNQVLTCRQVCKRWNKLISNFLVEAHPSLAPASVPVPLTIPVYPSFKLFEGLRVTTLSLPLLLKNAEFLNHFNGNPLPGRHLKVKLFPETEQDKILGDPNNFCAQTYTPLIMNRFLVRLLHYYHLPPLTSDQVIPLLEALSPQVWYLTLETNLHAEINHSEFVLFLVTCLNRLPNLKSIILEGRLCFLSHHLDQVPILEALQQEITLPALPNLECLLIKTFNFPVIIEQLLYQSYGPQLSKVSLALEVLTNLQTANLTELTIRYSKNPGNPVDDDDLFMYWHTLRCPNLKALDLDVVEVKLRTVVDILERCPQLKILKLVTTLPISMDNMPTNFQAPGNLQHIQVNDIALLSRPFLEKIGSLKFIDFFEEPETYVNNRNLRIPTQKRLRSFDGGDLYNSYVWQVLPKLRRIVHVIQMDPSRHKFWNQWSSRTFYDRETYNQLSNV